MMTWLILIFLFLAVFHLVYEAILLPTIRQSLRYRLFALRDQLRRMTFNPQDPLDEEVFESLQESLNSSVKLVPVLNLSTIDTLCRVLRTDEQLRREVNRRDQLIKNCPKEEIRGIRDKRNEVMARVLAANAAALLVYLLPVAIVVGLALFLKVQLLNPTMDLILSAPEHDLHRLVPSGLATA